MRPGWGVLVVLAVAIGFCVILAPILVVVLLAFSADEVGRFPPTAVSLRWFRAFFEIHSLRSAFIFSVQLGVISATMSVMVATLASLRAYRMRPWGSGAVQMLFVAPLIFPSIVLGLALLLYFRALGVSAYVSLVIAHVLVGAPYAFRMIFSQMQSFDETLVEAGQSLGASPLSVFLQITLPIIWPGVLSGWLFAFVVSLGELNTALFLVTPSTTTLPIELFGYLQFEGNQLIVAAASTLQIILILAVMILIELAGRLAASRKA